MKTKQKLNINKTNRGYGAVSAVKNSDCSFRFKWRITFFWPPWVDIHIHPFLKAYKTGKMTELRSLAPQKCQVGVVAPYSSFAQKAEAVDPLGKLLTDRQTY